MRAGDGRDIIYDFTDGEDFIDLEDELTLADISFVAFSSNPNFTEIIGPNAESLALLPNIAPDQLDEDDISPI